MTTKADYTDEEWEALRRAPLVAGLAVSFADPGGPIELTKESMAAAAFADPPGDDRLVAVFETRWPMEGSADRRMRST